jgi:hypothetical protein
MRAWAFSTQLRHDHHLDAVADSRITGMAIEINRGRGSEQTTKLGGMEAAMPSRPVLTFNRCRFAVRRKNGFCQFAKKGGAGGYPPLAFFRLKPSARSRDIRRLEPGCRRFAAAKTANDQVASRRNRKRAGQYELAAARRKAANNQVADRRALCPAITVRRAFEGIHRGCNAREEKAHYGPTGRYLRLDDAGNRLTHDVLNVPSLADKPLALLTQCDLADWRTALKV